MAKAVSAAVGKIDQIGAGCGQPAAGGFGGDGRAVGDRVEQERFHELSLGDGCGHFEQGFAGEHHPPLGYRAHVAGEPQPGHGFQIGLIQPDHIAQVLDLLAGEPEPFQRGSASPSPAATRNPRSGGSSRTNRLNVAGARIPWRR